MNRKRLIIISSSILALILIIWFFAKGEKEDKNVFATVTKGDFEINVFTTGELEAKNKVNIFGPEGIRSVGIWQVKISDLVPEGTVVKEGDYIGALDQTELANKIKDVQSELQKAESQYSQTQLDTTLQMRQSRDELVNLGFQLKEKEITLEQSAYEPPATIRQIQLDLEKTKRTYDQTQKNYKIKQEQLKAKMQEAGANYAQAQNKLEALQEVMGKFTITAPSAGMVIYDREWNGNRKTVGATISAWDPTVATLPDLSVMISRTYVNEVDIRKIKKDQKVKVTLDAFPEKKLSGKVVSVANVGEQSKKTDAKVFEVVIQINEKDTTLRPAMTTGNNIVIEKVPAQLYIPLECIHNQGDSLTYVYKKEGLGLVKKEIKTGQTNENFAVIKAGLEDGEKVYLSVPKNAEKAEVVRLEKKQTASK